MHDTPHPNPRPPYPGLDPEVLRLVDVEGHLSDWAVLVETLKRQASKDDAVTRDVNTECVYSVTVLTDMFRRMRDQRYALHKEAQSLRISLMSREQTIRRHHDSKDKLLRELRPLRELNHSLRTSLEAAEADNHKLAQDNEALRLRAEAAEARLGHEQANTETGARLCNEAFAVLTTKVHTLEAKLAKAEKAHDTALSALEAKCKDYEELRKEVGVLTDWRDTLAGQRADAINQRDAALRQSTAQLRRVEELEAELTEARHRGNAAVADLAGVVRQRNERTEEREELRTHLGAVLVELAEARRRGDAAVADLAGVVRQRNERTEELEVLRKRVVELVAEEREVLRKRVVELAAELAEARRRGDAALRQVQELRTAQQDTHRPSSVRVTIHLTEEDDGTPD